MSSHWTHYWNTASSLNSFSEGSMAAGYAGELQSYWHTVFSTVAATGTILDIGTGNGGIAVLAQQFNLDNNRAAKVLATDAAAISPEKIQQKFPELADVIKLIRFFPNTAIEQMPFAKDSIALICSQFALEYAHPETAVASCMRVLEPSGQLVAVIHHADTALLKQSRAIVSVLDDFESAEFNTIKRYFEDKLQQLLQQNSEVAYQGVLMANKKLLTFAMGLKEKSEKLGLAEDVQDILQKFASCFMNLSAETPKQIAFFLHEIKAYKMRLQDQIAAAWDSSVRQHWLAEFSRYNCQVSCEPLYIEDSLFAWNLQVIKR